MAKKVLVVDDDEGILDIAKIVLSEKGYEVTILQISKQIYKVVKKIQPDIILLDLWMPHLSGDVIAKELKKNPETAHIPIILISAVKDIKSVANSVESDAFIGKPFDIEVLEDTVERIIG